MNSRIAAFLETPAFLNVWRAEELDGVWREPCDDNERVRNVFFKSLDRGVLALKFC